MKRTTHAALLGGLLLSSPALSACDASHQDAPQPRAANIDRTAPDHVIAFQDEFPNVSTKCAGFGHYRLWVTSHSKNDVPPVVMTDESCP
jgi:hypothetical protein